MLSWGKVCGKTQNSCGKKENFYGKSYKACAKIKTLALKQGIDMLKYHYGIHTEI